MTIRRNVDIAALNTHFGNFEECIENAPAGTYEDEKLIRHLIGDCADRLMEGLKALGLDTPNCDQIREVEAVMYGYVRDANPLNVAAAEGFGMAMDGPARERVIAGAIRDRDFLSETMRRIEDDDTPLDVLQDRADQRYHSQ
jgi:hypothetical protein